MADFEEQKRNLISAFANLLRSSSLAGKVNIQKMQVFFGQSIQNIQPGSVISLAGIYQALLSEGASTSDAQAALLFFKKREARYQVVFQLPNDILQLSEAQQQELLTQFSKSGLTTGTFAGKFTPNEGDKTADGQPRPSIPPRIDRNNAEKQADKTDKTAEKSSASRASPAANTSSETTNTANNPAKQANVTESGIVIETMPASIGETLAANSQKLILFVLFLIGAYFANQFLNGASTEVQQIRISEAEKPIPCDNFIINHTEKLLLCRISSDKWEEVADEYASKKEDLKNLARRVSAKSVYIITTDDSRVQKMLTVD